MTPDEWVRSPDGQTVVEAGARAAVEGWHDWQTMTDDERGAWLALTNRMLLAALRVQRMTPCPDCDGTGHADRRSIPPNYSGMEPCPTCAGAGVVPGVPLLVDALMEREPRSVYVPVEDTP